MPGIDPCLLEERHNVAEIVAAWYTGLQPFSGSTANTGSAPVINADLGQFITGAKTNSLYYYYPFLFADAFPKVPIQTVREIAVAGCLYFKHLLLQDSLIDNQPGDKPSGANSQIILLSALLHEKSLTNLQCLFPPASPFWNYLMIYHNEFVAAVLLETTRHREVCTYTEQEWRQIARGKSALTKAATAALAILAQDESKIVPLDVSQNWVAIGFQLYDDIKDWKKDYQREHYSYPLTRTIIEGGLEQQITQGRRPAAKSIGQILYYSGLAEALLEQVNISYQEALHCVEDMSCPQWVNHIQLLQENCRRLQADLGKIRAETMTVYQRLSRKEKPGLTTALARAVCFLESAQMPEGSWGDFRTSAGLSTGWVAGYVGEALGQCGRNGEILANARRWLMDNRLPEGGWAYRPLLPIDADSTSWCLFLLNRVGGDKEALDRAIQALKTHQSTTDGGFRTYRVAGPIREVMHLSESTDFSGWCTSQLCVTAVAIQALLQSGVERAAPEVQAALEYVRGQQEEAGYWEAYWWDGRMYSTCHAVKALKMAGGNGDEYRCQRAEQWLLSVQLEDGSWNNGVEGQGRPFHTALAIQALLAIQAEAAGEAVSRGVEWLLGEQVGDGSWRTYPILRVPHPWVLQPWAEPHAEENDGTGIIVRDHERLFTTATVLVALEAYGRRTGEITPESG